MLILGRKAGENIKVFKKGNLNKLEFMFTVLSVGADGLVRIGINSGAEYEFLRDEVYRKVVKEKKIEPIKDKYTKDEIRKKWGNKPAKPGKPFVKFEVKNGSVDVKRGK